MFTLLGFGLIGILICVCPVVLVEAQAFWQILSNKDLEIYMILDLVEINLVSFCCLINKV